ncbi:MAG: glycosyltransferase family 2 protein [Lachnospiraceae bacterium]|nr:glycosyltransferase family 2 protein [Lachnospiraceae bacterium]
MSLTIVTPTYNRERELAELYDSLKAQTEPDFVWLIVDDGSTDGTEENVRGWQREGALTLRYLKKKNGGKHTCVNLAMNWVDTELVMIVDSDDRLTEDAAARILAIHEKYREDESLCGYTFLRGFPDGSINGAPFPTDEWKASYITARVNADDMRADKAEVFRTEILKQYPFPEIEGENFIGEDVVWMRMARKYFMIHVNEVVYIGDYLEDGLTKNRRAHNIACPKGCVLRALEFMKPDVAMEPRLKGSIQYIVYGRFAGLSLQELIAKARFPQWAKLAAAPGEAIYRKWKREYDA